MYNFYDGLQVYEHPNRPLSVRERLLSMEKPLLEWYRRHARELPWRDRPEPYRVWISEIMLQQTRVEAVKPYFERFVENLPTVEDLAEISEERLLKLWEGLGYYSRARNLKKAAEIIVEKHESRVPSGVKELLALPGIGSYTAGAISSIAYGNPVPAVDGNVLRVISRVLECREDILKQSVKRKVEEELSHVIPTDNAGGYNQGLIEIGALVCVPNGPPKCLVCPLSFVCLAGRNGTTGEIPVKTPKKERRIEDRTVLLLENNGKIVIRKRREEGLLAALYEFPNLEGTKSRKEIADLLRVPEEAVEELPSSTHIFSHVEWHMIGYRVKLAEKDWDDGIFVSKVELKGRYPLPNAFYAYTKLIK